jgi:hypothetical protein
VPPFLLHSSPLNNIFFFLAFIAHKNIAHTHDCACKPLILITSLHCFLL